MGACTFNLFLVFVTCALQTSLAIKCFSCRSDLDPKCADPFDNSTIAISDCTYERDVENLPGVRPNVCMKVRQKGNDGYITMRSCGWALGIDNNICNNTNVEQKYCSICSNKDGCNSAPGSLLPSVVSVLATAVLAVLLKVPA